jgi:hypothetical protein
MNVRLQNSAYLTRVTAAVVVSGAHEYVWYVFVSASSQKHTFTLVVANDRHSHLLQRVIINFNLRTDIVVR